MKQLAVLLLQLIFVKVYGDAVSDPAQFQYYIPPPVILTAPSTIRPVPDINIKYWASWKINTTIFDAAGLPWYCYTYRQTHCRPLFHLPADWRPTTDKPGTTTVVKIKKRPKDGIERQMSRPNDLPNIDENHQNNQNEIENNDSNLQSVGQIDGQSVDQFGQKIEQQDNKNVADQQKGNNVNINGQAVGSNGRRNDRYKNRTIELGNDQTDDYEGSQEDNQKSQENIRRNDRFKNRTIDLETDYEGSQENDRPTGGRNKGRGPLTTVESPRSFDTNLTIVPTTKNPDDGLPFSFFTTQSPQLKIKNGSVEQNTTDNETPPYSTVNIQTPRPKERSTTVPPIINDTVLLNADGTPNITIVIGKVTPINKNDIITTTATTSSTARALATTFSPSQTSTNTAILDGSRITEKTGESTKDKGLSKNGEESAATGKGNGTNNSSFVDKKLAGKIGSENDVKGDDENMQTTTRVGPSSTLTLGFGLNASNIKEGDDVYFECSVKVDPKPFNITWRHNGQELIHNIQKKVIISNQSLILLTVTRSDSGDYTCTAQNMDGDGTSNSITLDVSYETAVGVQRGFVSATKASDCKSCHLAEKVIGVGIGQGSGDQTTQGPGMALVPQGSENQGTSQGSGKGSVQGSGEETTSRSGTGLAQGSGKETAEISGDHTPQGHRGQAFQGSAEAGSGNQTSQGSGIFSAEGSRKESEGQTIAGSRNQGSTQASRGGSTEVLGAGSSQGSGNQASTQSSINQISAQSSGTDSTQGFGNQGSAGSQSAIGSTQRSAVGSTQATSDQRGQGSGVGVSQGLGNQRYGDQQNTGFWVGSGNQGSTTQDFGGILSSTLSPITSTPSTNILPGFTSSDVFRPRSSPSLFTPTWTADPANTLVPLPDAPPFTYEPGRGYVVTGSSSSLGNFGSTLPWTSTRGVNQGTEFGTFVVTPNFGQATPRPEGNGPRLVSGSGQASFATTPISNEGFTGKAIEETPRFFPTAANNGTATNQRQNTTSLIGDGANKTVDETGRDRAINVGQISDNSFVPPSGSSSLRPTTKFGVEMSEGPTTSQNGISTLDDTQIKTATFNSRIENETDFPGNDKGPSTPSESSSGNRPNIFPNGTSSSETGESGSGDVTTLRPDPSPRIGTDMEIFVNGTEVFPAYTVFGEPCKDECSKRGYSYTWCTKADASNLGTWSTTDYCTTEQDSTPFGDKCSDACEKRGEPYYWCHKVTTLWSFCTPEHLLNQARAWKNAPRAIPMAYTVHGEACKDECKRRGYSYTWCTKSTPSSLGSWRHTDYCTESPKITSDGKRCSEECGFLGYSYSWCLTETSWGYCTHPSFVDFLTRLRNETLESALGGKRTSTRTTTTTTTPTTLQIASFQDETTSEPRQQPVNNALIASDASPVKISNENVGGSTSTEEFKIIREVSTEPPLKVKINKDILQASELNSEAYPKHYNVAKAFTVYGESCRDECTFRDGYPYTWCHKVELSSVGTWSDSGYCTNSHKVTHMGEDCIDECSKRGQAYYWCHKLTALWGFCTPKILLSHFEKDDS